MEPEISHKATIGGCFSIGALKAKEMPAPPERNVCRKLRRGSTNRPRTTCSNRRDFTRSSGKRMRAINRRACAICSLVICAKSLFCRTSRSDTVKRADNSRSSLISSSFLAFGKKASATRNAPASGFLGEACGSDGARGDSWAISLSMKARLRQNKEKACEKIRECSFFLTKAACNIQ